MSKILVTGATGPLGKGVINALSERVDRSELAVLVRDASKVEDLKAKGIDIRVGDYNDQGSLVKAFTGIEKLFFVSGSDIATRLTQHENVVAAASEAGVKHVIYTSFQRENDTETSPISFVAASHIHAENLLKASGMTYTLLKHGLYMDMLPLFLGDQVLETGVIYQPAGDGKAAFTLRQDLAEFGATILTTAGHENKIYEAYASRAYTYQEIAEIISSLTGKSIRYISPTPEEFTKNLGEAGVPAEYVGMFAAFAEAIRQGEFAKTSTEIETILGRKTTNISDFLKGVYG